MAQSDSRPVAYVPGSAMVDAPRHPFRRWHVPCATKGGATHLSVNTMGAGLETVDGHVAALATAAEAAKTISG